MTGLDLQGVGAWLPVQEGEAARPRLVGPPQVQAPEGEAAGGPQPNAFATALASAIGEVDGLSREVGDKVRSLATGEPVALHDIMMSMGKSEVAFNLMLEVRNKLVEAWEKLSRSVV